MNLSGCCGTIPNCLRTFTGKCRRFAVTNYVGPPANRRGENMPIVGIGKVDLLDQTFVASHQRICRVEIH